MRITRSTTIGSTEPLNERVDGRGVADHVVGVKIEADFSGAGGDEENGLSGLRGLEASRLPLSQRFLNTGSLDEFIAFEPSHRAGELLDRICERPRLCFCGLMLTDRIRDFHRVIGFADKDDDPLALKHRRLRPERSLSRPARR